MPDEVRIDRELLRDRDTRNPGIASERTRETEVVAEYPASHLRALIDRDTAQAACGRVTCGGEGVVQDRATHA
jgi:hypothetical protein